METQEQTFPAIKPEITFEDFMKMDIRLCQIISIEKVEGKDKLYKLEIDTGLDKRTVVSAIAHIFKQEDLHWKTLPFVLNLPVRKIAGIESHGMIMLAEATMMKETLMIGSITSTLGVGAIVV